MTEFLIENAGRILIGIFAILVTLSIVFEGDDYEAFKKNMIDDEEVEK